MPDYKYKHVVKIAGDEKADHEIRELIADGWERDESADSGWLVFDPADPQKEIPAAKYTFKRENH